MSSKRFLGLGVALFLGAAVGGACGGRSELNFGDDGGADASDAGPSPDAADAADAHDAMEEGETGSVEAGEAGDAAADVDAGTDSSFLDSSMFEAGTEAGDDSSLPEAGSDGATDSGTEGGPADGGEAGTEAGLDASSEGSAPITCGMATCNPTTQECCVSPAGATCTAVGQCTGVNLSCTGSDNCTGGEVCCVTFGGGAPSASCEPSCAGGPGGGVQLCSGNQDCTPPRRCRQTPLGFGICR